MGNKSGLDTGTGTRANPPSSTGDPPGESLGGCLVNGGENNLSRKRREHISRILITADRCHNVAKTISMSISTLTKLYPLLSILEGGD